MQGDWGAAPASELSSGQAWVVQADTGASDTSILTPSETGWQRTWGRFEEYGCFNAECSPPMFNLFLLVVGREGAVPTNDPSLRGSIVSGRGVQRRQRDPSNLKLQLPSQLAPPRGSIAIEGSKYENVHTVLSLNNFHTAVNCPLELLSSFFHRSFNQVPHCHHRILARWPPQPHRALPASESPQWVLLSHP
jgi:hypothetical protein